MKKITIFCIVLFTAFSVFGQTNMGPINTPQVNRIYYVGTTPGWYATIQLATTASCAAHSGHGVVVIENGITTSDTPTTVTSCTNTYIIDQTSLPNKCYSGTTPAEVSCVDGALSGVTSFNTRSGVVTLLAADVNAVGAITNSTSGNSATASALATTPTQCSGGTPLATGIAANGNANCTATSSSVDIQTAGVSNTSQTVLNHTASSVNATGLTLTPTNPSGGIEKYEVAGTVNPTSGGTGQNSVAWTGIPFTVSGVWNATSNATLDSSGNGNFLGQLGIGLSRANTSHVLDSSGLSNSTTLTGANPVELRIANTDITTNNYEGVVGAMTNSTPAVVTAGKMTWVNTSHTAAAESADLHFLNRNAGTVTDWWTATHDGTWKATSNLWSITAAGAATLPVVNNVFYQQSGDTIASIEAECSSPCTYVVTAPQTITLSASHVLAANVFPRYEANGLWTINGAFTFTFTNTPVSNTPNQHFAGTSTLAGFTGAVPVEWFGAIGYTTKSAASSGTDYTTLIQKTLNSITGYGCASLRALYYQASSGLSITTSGIGICGATGRDSYPANAAVSSIVSNSATVNILTVKGTAFTQPGFLNWNTFSNFSVERLTQPSGTVPTQAVGIYLQYLQGVKLTNVSSNDSFDGFYLNGTTTAGWGIFDFINCSNGLLTVNSYTTGQNLNCMDLDSSNGIPLNSMYFDKVSGGAYNTAIGSGVTSRVFYIHGTTINDIDMLYPGGAQINYGIDIEYTVGGAPDSEADIHIVQPIFDSVLTSAIKINGLSAIGGQPTVTIEGGYFLTNNNGLKVIDCESSAGVSILGNQFLTIGPTGDTGIFGAGCTNSIVANNKVQGFDNGTFLNFTASSNNNTILGNNLLGVASTPMSNGFVFDGTSLTNDYGLNTIGANVTTPLTGNPTGKVIVTGVANTFTANQAISLSGSVAQWSVFNSLSTGVAQFTALNDASVGMTYAVNGSAGAVFGVIGVNDGYMLSASNLDILTVTAGGVIKFGTNTAGAERMRIAANGGVTVGDSTFGGTSPGAGVIAAQNGAKFGTSGQATFSSAGVGNFPTGSTVNSSLICTAAGTVVGCPTLAVSNAITSATGGSGTGTVTCASAACTNLRGNYTVAGGTFATGTLLSLVWPTTTTAYVCTASVLNNATGASIGYHSIATATGMDITSLTAATGLSVDIDYSCRP